MKDQEKNLMLWQKRNELRISDDIQQDWLDMFTKLDEQMPVSNIPATGGGASSLTGFIKLLSALFIAAGIAALVYFSAHKNKSAGSPKTYKSIKSSRNTKLSATSTSINKGNADSLAAANSINAVNNQTAINPDIPSTNETRSSGNVKNHNTATGADNAALLTTAVKNSNTNVHNTITGKSNRNSHTKNPSNSSFKNNGSVFNGQDNKTRYAASRTTAYKTKNLNKSGRLKSPGNSITSVRHRTAAYGRLFNSNRRRVTHPSPHHGLIAANSKTGKNGINGSAFVNNNSPLSDPTSATASLNGPIDLAAVYGAALNTNAFTPPVLPAAITDQFKNPSIDVSQNAKNGNNKSAQNAKNSKLDWGILAGVNEAGSFTAKDQNANFYGSLPLDAFVGLFATYHINNRWGLNSGFRIFNPHTVSGSYTHANQSKKDTNQTLYINDSRKIYFIDLPLNLVYKPNAMLSLKAGPVFSLPIKQVNGISTFQTGPLKKDSLYYVSVKDSINATKYTRSINLGVSAGLSLQFGRFIFDAAYIRSLSGQTISSPLGSYTANTNGFIFTLSFKLNGWKK